MKRKLSSSQDIECPLCSRKFPSSFIDLHVNSCLKLSNAVPPKNQTWSTNATTTTSTTTTNAVNTTNTTTTTTKNSAAAILSPLADRMRPQKLADLVGQDQKLMDALQLILSKGTLPSMIFYGPPGCGKTTLARILGRQSGHRFVSTSACTAGLAELKKLFVEAENRQKLTHEKTVLFVDEIHRFNKLQQDIFLPFIESGIITLIGATTENPSFEVNAALLSRCQVFVCSALAVDNVKKLIKRALTDTTRGLAAATAAAESSPHIWTATDEAVDAIAACSGGDGRVALNLLERSASIVSAASGNQQYEINEESVDSALQGTTATFVYGSQDHFDIISALHKSIRGGDIDASLYYLARMLHAGDSPLYVARRLIRAAVEDIGIADPLALNQAIAAQQAVHFLGKPEGDLALAQCVVYLARAPKSVAVYKAFSLAQQAVADQPNAPVPLHIRDTYARAFEKRSKKIIATSADDEERVSYLYTPDHPGVEQQFLPTHLCNKNIKFFVD